MIKKEDTNSIFKMKDLIDKTGINRETIHFYLTEGLLPPAKKTSKNMSWYSKEHIDRLNIIKNLQENQFLPLKAIKSILNNSSDYDFTEEQRKLISELKLKIVDSSQSINVSIDELIDKKNIAEKDIEKLVNVGFINKDEKKNTLTLEDYNLLDNWLKLKELDSNNTFNFAPEDLKIFIDTVEIIFNNEVSLLKNKLNILTLNETKTIIEKAVPLVNNIISILHNKKINQFLTKFG
ncbi:MAG: MerR family transcriptional regulator [Cyanobacteriota bacterium]|mgnify:CR=1 FL=1